MILKSTSRKDKNFRQIVAYLHKEIDEEEQAITYLHNIDVDDPCDLSGIVSAFETNEQFRKQRKNGVVFFHEIMAFAPQDSAAILTKPDMLRDLIDQYIQLRAPHAIVLAKPHLEEDHVHIHFVISGSEWRSDRSTRIGKFDLEKIKEKIRAYQQEQYPELQYSYQKGRGVPISHTWSHATWQMEKRGQIQDRKKLLKSILLEALRQAHSWEEVIKHLRNRGVNVYKRRGRIAGIVWEGKRFRFSTLIEGEQKQIEVLEKCQEEIFDRDKKAEIFKLPEQWQQIQVDLEVMEKMRNERQQGIETKRGDLGLDRER